MTYTLGVYDDIVHATNSEFLLEKQKRELKEKNKEKNMQTYFTQTHTHAEQVKHATFDQVSFPRQTAIIKFLVDTILFCPCEFNYPHFRLYKNSFTFS